MPHGHVHAHVAAQGRSGASRRMGKVRRRLTSVMAPAKRKVSSTALRTPESMSSVRDRRHAHRGKAAVRP
eukprot:1587857-Prymnesium_polylepis.2